jgi:hypothetical protein
MSSRARHTCYAITVTEQGGSWREGERGKEDQPDAHEVVEQGGEGEDGECGISGTRFASSSVVFVVQIIFVQAEVARVVVVDLPDDTVNMGRGVER